MAFYRVYFLSAEDRVIGLRVIYSPSDTDAVEACRKMLAEQEIKGGGFEVWQQGRRVCRELPR